MVFYGQANRMTQPGKLLSALARSILRGGVYACGIAAVSGAALWWYRPMLLMQLTDHVGLEIPGLHSASAAQDPGAGPADGTAAGLGSWKPINATMPLPESEIRIGSQAYSSLQSAADAVSMGEVIHVGPGIYGEGFTLRQDHVTVVGIGHVILDNAAVAGKGAMVIQGDFTRITNIECRNTAVRDRNGACVRLAGKHLELEHVYFHDSEQGILSGPNPGQVEVRDSRFERLGESGRAHGIYLSGGEGALTLVNSQILSSRRQGHEVKSRLSRLHIDRSVIASLNGEDSRLVDLPHGGEVVIENSVLQQGPRSSNRDVIGFGVEGRLHSKHSMKLRNNVIIMERPGGNILVHDKTDSSKLEIINNVIIGSGSEAYEEDNLVFETRRAAGLEAFPVIPKENQP
jgi:hypothetical protein